MTKLEQLIKELCPNGVEYKNLGKLFPFIRNGFVGTVTPFYTNAQNGIRYLQGTNIHNGIISDNEEFYITKEFHAKHSKNELKNNDILMVQSGHVGECAVVGEKYKGSNCHALIIMSNGGKCNSYYVRYYLQSSSGKRALEKITTGGTVKHILASKIKNVIIPVPPIEVQAEIVKILDEYTESVTALQQELEAELTARKKQYEYYRDLLLDFGVHGGETSELEWRTIKEIAENCDSKRKPVTKGKRTSGIYPYYGASGIVDYVDDYLFDGDYLLISEDGANLLARSTPIAFSISGKNWVNNHAHVLRFDTYVTRRFVEIYLNSINLEKYISTAAQPKLTQDNLNKIPIPYPTIEEQTRIVNILDRFDKLCNDISEGLPAEIEARRKQYEYYRDKLLSFEEVRT